MCMIIMCIIMCMINDNYVYDYCSMITSDRDMSYTQVTKFMPLGVGFTECVPDCQ